MRNSVLIILLALSFASCTTKVFHEENRVLADNKWTQQDIEDFSFTINDTNAVFHLYINMMNTTNYPFKNIWFFTNLKTPEGQEAIDTLEFNLMDDRGNWYGVKNNDVIVNQMPWKINVHFPTPGEYRLSLEQGMRKPVLEGICEVGIRLEQLH